MTLKFDEVFSIMKKSFPQEEMRNYEGQKALLERDDYFIKTYMHEDEVAGFCAYYKFDNFIYIEHLACNPEVRGLGIGTKLVQQVIAEDENRVVILEVEPPVDELTKRRVRFYEKLGFKLNPHYHFQPSLNEGMEGVELKIMSSNTELSEEAQIKFRRVLNEKVYGVDKDLYI
ncbi:GNAT family N-acetyltransferase [Turicibacter sanguinis]|uniref:GNAT family N-acetyltransferase n=1 Tax=Turicibacter sanguinis TaxID=154288 RepID=UPI0018A891D3|nr:GNAT family N-acetyltransferase [Turicibacter sanguinis]MDB8553649.1 GNAT family N-acetyltransferase [Turicibacter sanguinis]